MLSLVCPSALVEGQGLLQVVQPQQKSGLLPNSEKEFILAYAQRFRLTLQWLRYFGGSCAQSTVAWSKCHLWQQLGAWCCGWV